MIAQGLLKHFYLFRDATAEDLAVIEADSQRLQCVTDELLYHEGEVADAMYLVEVGTIEIVSVREEVTVLVRVGSGGGFGETAFFDRGPRPAAARAVEPSFVIKIPYAVLARALEHRPSLARVFYPNACVFLAKRLRRTLGDLSFVRALNRRHF